jgi:nickel-type superoxide dismutase maturation protease
MSPALPPGAVVVARAIHDKTSVKAGDIVIARRPDRPQVVMVKRIHSIDTAGTIFLLGDNPLPLESTDSRDFGPVTRGQIIARVVWRCWPLPPRRF